jgi:hypothetical protein
MYGAPVSASTGTRRADTEVCNYGIAVNTDDKVVGYSLDQRPTMALDMTA